MGLLLVLSKSQTQILSSLNNAGTWEYVSFCQCDELREQDFEGEAEGLSNAEKEYSGSGVGMNLDFEKKKWSTITQSM